MLMSKSVQGQKERLSFFPSFFVPSWCHVDQFTIYNYRIPVLFYKSYKIGQDCPVRTLWLKYAIYLRLEFRKWSVNLSDRYFQADGQFHNKAMHMNTFIYERFAPYPKGEMKLIVSYSSTWPIRTRLFRIPHMQLNHNIVQWRPIYVLLSYPAPPPHMQCKQ